MPTLIWNLDEPARRAITAELDAAGAIYDDEDRLDAVLAVAFNTLGPGRTAREYATSVVAFDDVNRRDR